MTPFTRHALRFFISKRRIVFYKTIKAFFGKSEKSVEKSFLVACKLSAI